jgi:hypothetical protein
MADQTNSQRTLLRRSHVHQLTSQYDAQGLEMTDQAGSMQAIVFDAPGGPEVLHTTSLDVPVPEATQVRLRCEGDRG